MFDSFPVWFWVLLAVTYFPVGFLWNWIYGRAQLDRLTCYLFEGSTAEFDGHEPLFVIGLGWTGIVLTLIMLLAGIGIFTVMTVCKLVVMVLKLVGLVSKDYQFK